MPIDADVTFANTIFTATISFEGTTFGGDANFSDIKAERSIYFRRAQFKGSSADFQRAEVAGQLAVDQTTFVALPNFERARVAQTISLRNAHFQRGAIFSGAQVGGDFVMDYAEFGREGLFEGMKVKGDIYLVGTRFTDVANFREVDT